jgi:thiol-disulfide isomerase/thioredoxin
VIVMMSAIENSLVFIAEWGTWILAGLILLVSLGLWRLGRGRRFLIPRGWTGKLGAAVLALVALVAGFGLFLLLGPLAPVLADLRRLDAMVGQAAPDLAFKEVAGGAPRRLHDLRGKVVLVNLWATWCPPCRKEMPALDRLQSAYRDRGLVVVNLSNEDEETLRKFAAEHPMGTLYVRADELGWLDAEGRPLTFVIDRQGVIRGWVTGDREYEEFAEMVQPHLGV